MKRLSVLFSLLGLSACLSASPLDNENVSQPGAGPCALDSECARGEVCLSGACIAAGADRPVCGDKLLRTDLSPGQAGYEQCDDGNDDDTDACRNDCTSAFCGDGILRTDLADGDEGFEQCDQGEANSDDEPNACRMNCQSPSCGDGTMDEDESCDDGNEIDTDVCLNDCTVAGCGDGIRRTDLADGDEGFEQCDQGEANSDDEPNACRMNCQSPSCGDGTMDEGEGCDDGNEIDTDACRNDCTSAFCGDGILRTDLADGDEGFEQCDQGEANSDDESNVCRMNCQSPSCGDGTMDEGEACDDGNQIQTDDCLSNCVVASCGDDVVRAGVEACDDGNRVDQDACRNTCQANNLPTLDAVTINPLRLAKGATATCLPSVPGAIDTDGDDIYFEYQWLVGGQVIATDQVIIVTSNPGTSLVCRITANDYECNLDPGGRCGSPVQSNPVVIVHSCGDGIVHDPAEACDDGNQTDTDACRNDCTVASCGDGVLRLDLNEGQAGHEVCDDGNQVDNDGCSATCTLEHQCGNGVVEGNEACDDGNADTQDACTNACQMARCGDGVQRGDLQEGDDDYEHCDDGNDVDTDACRNNCDPAGCGDGVVYAGHEECDDQNGNDNDGCTGQCQNAECGDGVVRNGVEQCDDGNNNDNDQCRNNCTSPAMPVALIDSGAEHTCVVRDPDEDGSGVVYCWGANDKHQLATNNDPQQNGIEFSPSPRRIWPQNDQAPIVSLGAGNTFTHISYGSNVRTWGTSAVHANQQNGGDHNGLGHGASVDQLTTATELPAAAKTWGDDNILGVAGGFAMSAFRTPSAVYVAGCAIDGGGNNQPPNCHQTLQWGDDNHSERAISVMLNDQNFQPSDLMIGGNYLCATRQNNHLYCLGLNAPQIALGGEQNSSTTWWQSQIANFSSPLTVAGPFAGAKSLNCFNNGALVRCRGQNPNDNPATVTVRSIPQAEFPLRDLDVGDGVGCAVGGSGCVYCWGSNHEGQRGNGVRHNCQPGQQCNAPDFDEATPVSAFCGQNPTLAGGAIRSVTVSRSHVCVSKPGGAAVWCWGDTRKGQCGVQGNNTHQLTPRLISFGN